MRRAVDVSIPDGDSFLREAIYPIGQMQLGSVFQSPMGIVSSAKRAGALRGFPAALFQSPMGIVSSAKDTDTAP